MYTNKTISKSFYWIVIVSMLLSNILPVTYISAQEVEGENINFSEKQLTGAQKDESALFNFLDEEKERDDYISLVELGKLPLGTIIYDEPNENSKQVELDLEKEIFLVFYPYQFPNDYTSKNKEDIIVDNGGWIGIRQVAVDKINYNKYFFKGHAGFKLIIPSQEELVTLSVEKLEVREKDLEVVVKDLNNDGYQEIFLNYEIYNAGASGWAIERRYTIFSTEGSSSGYADKILFDFFDKYYESENGVKDKSNVFVANIDSDDSQEIIVNLHYEEWGGAPQISYDMLNNKINVLKWDGERYQSHVLTLKAQLVFLGEYLKSNVFIQIFLGVIMSIVVSVCLIFYIIFFHRKKKLLT